MNEEKRIATAGVSTGLAMTGDGERAVEDAGPYSSGGSERTPELIGAEIRMYVDAGRRVTLLCGIEIGRRLCEAKDMLQHGEWLPWLSRETDFSDRTAQNYMKAFREYGAAQLGMFGPETNTKSFADLPISKALALLSVPESEREAFAEEVGAEGLSVEELKQAIRERDEALKREKEARVELLQADEGHALRVAELEEKLIAAREEAEKGRAMQEAARTERMEKESLERQLSTARETIHELENRPVEVAVEKDEAAIEEAARTARAKAEAAAAEQCSALRKQLDAALKKAEKAEKAAEKARKDAESAGEQGKAEIAKAAQEAARARQEAEELRKELKLADPETAKFGVIFGDVQQGINRLSGMIESMKHTDPEKAGKLSKAACALLGAALKELGGEEA